MAERFDWERDCGTEISPLAAVDQANAAGLSFEDYARQYVEQMWPFDEPPADPETVINGMVDAMDAALHVERMRLDEESLLKARRLGDLVQGDTEWPHNDE